MDENLNQSSDPTQPNIPEQPFHAHKKALFYVALFIFLFVVIALSVILYYQNNKTARVNQISTYEKENLILKTHTLALIPPNLNTRFSYYEEESFVFNDDGSEVMYLAQGLSTS